MTIYDHAGSIDDDDEEICLASREGRMIDGKWFYLHRFLNVAHHRQGRCLKTILIQSHRTKAFPSLSKCYEHSSNVSNNHERNRFRNFIFYEPFKTKKTLLCTHHYFISTILFKIQISRTRDLQCMSQLILIYYAIFDMSIVTCKQFIYIFIFSPATRGC